MLASAADRSTALFDLRTPDSLALSSSVSLTSATLASFPHPATPSCLVAGPTTGSAQFASGAHDGVVRVWDLRSAGRTIAALRAWAGGADKASAGQGGGKVLGLDWHRGLLGVGGEGGVELWRIGDDQGQ